MIFKHTFNNVELEYDTDDFECPITGEVMENPMTLSRCKHTFENGTPTRTDAYGRQIADSGSGLQGWLTSNNIYGNANRHNCPSCRAVIDQANRPEANLAMLAAIAAYKAAPRVAPPPRPPVVVNDAPRAQDGAAMANLHGQEDDEALSLALAQMMQQQFDDEEAQRQAQAAGRFYVPAAMESYQDRVARIQRENDVRQANVIRERAEAARRAAAPPPPAFQAQAQAVAAPAFPLPMLGAAQNGNAGGGFAYIAPPIQIDVARANAAAERERVRQEQITAAVATAQSRVTAGVLKNIKF